MNNLYSSPKKQQNSPCFSFLPQLTNTILTPESSIPQQERSSFLHRFPQNANKIMSQSPPKTKFDSPNKLLLSPQAGFNHSESSLVSPSSSFNVHTQQVLSITISTRMHEKFLSENSSPINDRQSTNLPMTTQRQLSFLRTSKNLQVLPKTKDSLLLEKFQKRFEHMKNQIESLNDSLTRTEQNGSETRFYPDESTRSKRKTSREKDTIQNIDLAYSKISNHNDRGVVSTPSLQNVKHYTKKIEEYGLGNSKNQNESDYSREFSIWAASRLETSVLSRKNTFDLKLQLRKANVLIKAPQSERIRPKISKAPIEKTVPKALGEFYLRKEVPKLFKEIVRKKELELTMNSDVERELSEEDLEGETKETKDSILHKFILMDYYANNNKIRKENDKTNLNKKIRDPERTKTKALEMDDVKEIFEKNLQSKVRTKGINRKQIPKNLKKANRNKSINKFLEEEEQQQQALQEERKKKRAKIRSKLSNLLWAAAYLSIFTKHIENIVTTKRKQILKDMNNSIESLFIAVENYLVSVGERFIRNLICETKSLDLYYWKKPINAKVLDIRANFIYDNLSGFLDKLISKTNQYQFPENLKRFLVSISQDYGVIPRNFLLDFELKRLQFNHYGNLRNMSSRKSKMTLGSFILLKVLVHRVIMRPWKVFPDISEKKVNKKTVSIQQNNQLHVHSDFRVKAKREPLKAFDENPDWEEKEFLKEQAVPLEKEGDGLVGFLSQEQLRSFFSDRKKLSDQLRALIEGWHDQIYDVIQDFSSKMPKKHIGILFLHEEKPVNQTLEEVEEVFCCGAMR